MTTRFPPPPDKAPHLQPGQVPDVLELGAIKYDTRTGSITPNPSGAINVAKPAKEQRR